MGICWIKVMHQSKPTTTCEVCECHRAEDVTINQTSRLSCTLHPVSSSSKDLPTHDIVESLKCCRTEPSSEVEREIEASKSHWSELSSKCDADGNGESNREIYEKLRLLPKYQHWLNTYGIHSSKDIILGPKMAEGGQAEIFEASDCRNTLGEHVNYVLKVFKEGYSLRDLQFQWPEGILSRYYSKDLLQGGVVLGDDRFAFLLRRCDIDLRKLIDVALVDDSPLWKKNKGPGFYLFPYYGTDKPLEEFRTYQPQARRYRCSMPIVKDQSAQSIMYYIALNMCRFHKDGVLHRDIKASNILCNASRDPAGQPRRISLYVVDFESSIGVVGTAFWRAPEILQQVLEQQPRIHFTREADVFSYAMTCYEILTGHIPFEGYKATDYDDVLNGTRPTLPDHVSTWLKDLICKCWHQDPSKRLTFEAIHNEIKSHGNPSDPFLLERHDFSSS